MNIKQLKLNLGLYQGDLKVLEERIIALKRVLRCTWTKPMSEEQRALHQLKQRATELYCLRAYSRGKLHRKRAPYEGQAEWNAERYHLLIAERLMPQYAETLELSA